MHDSEAQKSMNTKEHRESFEPQKKHSQPDWRHQSLTFKLLTDLVIVTNVKGYIKVHYKINSDYNSMLFAEKFSTEKQATKQQQSKLGPKWSWDVGGGCVCIVVWTKKSQ